MFDLQENQKMKTSTKIIIPVAISVTIVSFYLFMVANGYSPYYEGIRLERYSDYQLQEFLNRPENENNVHIAKITDNDLKNLPELRQLIEESLSMKYPLNEVGRVLITFEELDKFQQQYADILSEKYSRDSASFFEIDDRQMPEKYLEIDPDVYLRTFEGRYFEYDGIQYGIQPDTFYVPFMEDESLLHLEVYQTKGPLRSDHTWADLTKKQIEIMPKIIAAIGDIGQYQENIEVWTSGLPPETVRKHENWQTRTMEGHLFEYNGDTFSIGFWIA